MNVTIPTPASRLTDCGLVCCSCWCGAKSFWELSNVGMVKECVCGRNYTVPSPSSRPLLEGSASVRQHIQRHNNTVLVWSSPVVIPESFYRATSPKTIVLPRRSMVRVLVTFLVGAALGGLCLSLLGCGSAPVAVATSSASTPLAQTAAPSKPQPTKPKPIEDFAQVLEANPEILATLKEAEIIPITELTLDELKNNQHSIGQKVVVCGYVKSSLGNTLSLAVGKRSFVLLSPVQIEKGAIIASGTFQSDSVFIATEVKELKK